MIKSMNCKMTTKSQVSTTEPKKQKHTKQTTRTGTESQKWRSHGQISAGRGTRENGGKGTENKKHNWQVQNEQWEVKDSIGSGDAKELLCVMHGHELNGGNAGGWECCSVERDKGEKKMG